jgi:peptide chain release factor 2
MPGLPDAVETLTAAYVRWAERRGFAPRLVHEHHDAGWGGLAQSVLHVRGPFAFGWLRGESGAHRLARREGAALVLAAVIPDVEDEPLEDFQPQHLHREVIAHRDRSGHS